MKKTHYLRLSILVFFFFTSCVQKAPLTASKTKNLERPKRLLFLVFDQLRADLIDRYELKTFQQIRKKGISFPNAYVGHLSSVTIVSHAVMTSGLLPKNLPWQDEILKDTQGILGPKNQFYLTLDLEMENHFKLLAKAAPLSLPTLLKNAPMLSTPSPSPSPIPWGPIMAVAQKDYAAYVFGGPASDTIVTLGPKRGSEPLKGWRAPTGKAVPDFIQNPFGGKYFVDSNSKLGSEGTLYPFDGYRFFPSPDSKYIGGDAWVSSVALEYMKANPNWRAVFASFGAIDRVLHTLGEHDADTQEPWALKNKTTLRETLRRADQVLAELMRYLEEENLLEETLLVITADHGGQHSLNFHGNPPPGKPSFDFGKGKNFESTSLPASLRSAMETQLLDVSTHDTMLRFWLKQRNPVHVSKFAKLAKSFPGVAEVYAKQTTGKNVHYIRHSRHPDLKGDELEWAKDHNQELLESMASAGSPEVVAFLFDKHGYALKGEHGGAQREVQSIPLILLSPLENHRGKVVETPARLVDISPMVLRLMGIEIPNGLDGSNRLLDGF